MKLKCDLIIQNLNVGIRSNQQTKLHKSAYIGLYRPKIHESGDVELNDDDQDNDTCDKTQIILTVETSDTNMKFKLKRIETFTKFIREGKATLKLIDENIYLLISNTPALTLTNFISFLNVKLAKATLIHSASSSLLGSSNRNNSILTLNGKSKSNNDLLANKSMLPPAVPSAPKPQHYANKLLDRVQCSLGSNSLASISPLTEKDVHEVAKNKAKFGAGNQIDSPQSNPASKLTRSFSSSSLKPSSSSSSSSNKPPAASLQRSTSCADLLVQLTDEQTHVLKLIKQGRSVFFTGSGGSGKSFLINIIRRSLPSDATFVTASTGAAASLINGITVHAFTGFNLTGSSEGNSKENSSGSSADMKREDRFNGALTRVQNSRDKVQNWKRCGHLVIDEISMIDAEYFDCMDFVARAVRRSDSPMGGIQV
jgi:ATP-dependent DNA helicase PIF1